MDEHLVPDEHGLDDRLLYITPYLVIPRAELRFRTSRSGGPGGQHVNKVETKVELLFDIQQSPTLTEEQRARLLAGLTSWLDDSGVMHLISDRSRSQFRNREEALARFIQLLQYALRPQIPRKKTKKPRAVQEKRLQMKRERSEVKRLRSRFGDGE